MGQLSYYSDLKLGFQVFLNLAHMHVYDVDVKFVEHLTVTKCFHVTSTEELPHQIPFPVCKTGIIKARIICKIPKSKYFPIKVYNLYRD